MTELYEPEDELTDNSDPSNGIILSEEIIEIALRRLAECRANPDAMLTEEELWRRIDSKRKPRK
jgi:hypothetical protein